MAPTEENSDCDEPDTRDRSLPVRDMPIETEVDQIDYESDLPYRPDQPIHLPREIPALSDD
jgi:hypothetical protein